VREPVHSSGNEIILHTAPSVRSASRLLYLEPVSPTDATQDGRSFLAEYWRVIIHHLPLLAVILGAGATLGLLVSLWQTPVYQAKVTLELQSVDATLNLRIGDLQNGSATISPESYLPTQVQILQSRTLQQRALTKIQNDNIHNGPQRARRSSWRSALGFSKPLLSAGLPKVQTKVKVSDNTRILEITTESTDPEMAQAFANGLAEEYTNANLEARFDAMNQARKWLSHQLEETREKLRKSEDDLQAYGRSSNLMFTASKESVEQDKLKQLQEELSRAQANRIEKQSAYRIASSASADSLPQVIDNAGLMGYQTQLAALRQQLAQLTSQFTPEHYKVKSLQAQIDAVEATFHKERANILSRIRNDYKTAVFRENLLMNAYRTQSKMVTQQTQKTVNYNILERDVETNRQMYESLLQKAKEADVATAFRGSNVRIIDAAERPALPFKPNLILNGSLGGLLGLFVGLVLVTGRESFDRSFKAPGEVSFHLNLPELGVIPAGGYIAVNANGNGTRPVGLPPNGAANSRMPVGSVELATWREKSSVIAESFRSTITSILFAQQSGGSPRVLFVSSAKRGEGKTTVVSNLGAALAEINQRVLLIDGDMRKPRLNEIFDVSNNWGLSDLLREKTSLHDCPLEALVKRTEIANLFLLTSGPGTHSISNLLYSNRMLELIQRVRGEFDTILIDTPPLLDISDARILGRLADAGILVVRAGETSREMASAVKRRLSEDGIIVLGTILNAWDLKSMSRYGYGQYQYTHDHK
jgi:succinoglycan biosynthesis transport protein ExoP